MWGWGGGAEFLFSFFSLRGGGLVLEGGAGGAVYMYAFVFVFCFHQLPHYLWTPVSYFSQARPQ